MMRHSATASCFSGNPPEPPCAPEPGGASRSRERGMDMDWRTLFQETRLDGLRRVLRETADAPTDVLEVAGWALVGVALGMWIVLMVIG